MFEKILAYAILLIGIAYGIVILIISYKNLAAVKAAPGNLKILAPVEVVLFILASVGFPDYLMHTILGKHMDIVTDKELPGTLVGCGIVPGAIMSVVLLRKGLVSDIKTLVICGIAIVVGSILGGFLLGKLDGEKIKRILQVALILSLVSIIIKMIVSSGAVGTATSLSGTRLYVVAFLCFLSGIVNMMGVPMKPTRTAIFLLAGMSPIATVTAVVVLGSLSPISGGGAVLKQNLYQRKMVFASTVFGSIGAILGAFLVISIPALILNILLIAIMLIAIVVMFQK
ncbi:MAG: hypothetical protein J5928_02755 [Firmicutes bacterium]|nr:hypothetical protein [Bacillota bacterium]